MEFRMLGPLEVWEGDQRLPLGGPKHRALLAILLLNANRVVATDRLIELLWGDEPPETVNNTLQVSVSQLRKVLEPDHVRGTPHRVLVSQERGYLLRVSPGELDLGRYEQLRDEAKRARLDGHPDVAAAVLREALALWRGAPLADLALEPFAIAEASRLKELGLQTAEDRIEADLALGRHADVVGELEGLAAEHPLRERLRGQLMLALYRCGRQAEASDLFHKTRAALVDGLGMEPGPELQKLFKAILNQSPSLDLPPNLAIRHVPRTHNLPIEPSTFVGRERDIAEITRLLAGGSRLVTITGVGGVGKTRVAIHLAHRLVSRLRDGVWLAELASVADSSSPARIVASALGLREQPGHQLEDVVLAYLEGRQMLLVIDNCEHLIEPTAELIDKVLRHCPDIAILATSREALRVGAEVALTLSPLGLPAADVHLTPVELVQFDAIRLFYDRAAVAASISDESGLRSVVEICRQLDGLPLGIELAAATLQTLPVQQIAGSLDDRFRTLAAGQRTALRRQQTLEASIDWSYKLLSQPERTLFRRLAVFSGPFGVEHVRAICSGPPLGGDAAFTALGSLVTKSLVTFDARGPQARYSLLQTICQYAEERLARTADDRLVRAKHLDWNLSLAERAAVALHGPDQRFWLDRLDAEYSNLLQAMKWGLQVGAEATVRLALALAFFWTVRGLFGEGCHWLRVALEIPTDPLTRARALSRAGMLSCFQADYASAHGPLVEACRLLDQGDDPETLGLAIKFLGWEKWDTGHIHEGLPLFEQGVATARKAGFSWVLATNLNDLGFFLHLSGNRTPRPRALLEEALSIARELGDPWACGLILDSLAQVAADQSDFDSAQAFWDECITNAGALNDRFGLPAYLEGFARLAFARGDHGRAARLLAAAGRLRLDSGWSSTQPEKDRVDRMMEAARDKLGDAEAAFAWQEGTDMTSQHAIEYAIGSRQSTLAAP